MKIVLSLAFILGALSFSSATFAISFNVIGPCSSKPDYTGVFNADLNKSVGKNSVEIFDLHKVPYVGNENGMNTILNTPMGDGAIEILSDTKMRAYGWCFSVNGFIPDELAGTVYFKGQNDALNWFYAFSTYDQGVWTDYCVPAYTVKSPQFCK